VSRTHESFFPKIKNSFEIEQSDSCEKQKYNSNGNTTINLYNNIKLEDGITLNLIQNTSNTKTKLFFHVPNFEIYSIKVKILL
jgi:hypothetical protein